LVFQHQWDGEPFRTDLATSYTNAAGNTFTWQNLHYIISDLTITGNDEVIRVEHPQVHFIDRDTTILLIYQIPVGEYNNISFIFGLDERRNQTGLFPEISDMFWPEHMGGGYHYMMLDGWWTSPQGPRPANLHLGALEELSHVVNDTTWGILDTVTQMRPIVQIRIDSTFTKYHNFLRVSLSRNITVEANTITTVAPIIMDVEQWMESPLAWDFNVMGYGCIMRRRHAMDSLAINGAAGVFRGANVTREDIREFRTVTVLR